MPLVFFQGGIQDLRLTFHIESQPQNAELGRLQLLPFLIFFLSNNNGLFKLATLRFEGIRGTFINYLAWSVISVAD